MLDRIARKYSRTTSRYLEAHGTRVHYCIEGEGPTLVLLHGVLASLHTWDGWVKTLARHYRVVRVDLPGFGLSSVLANDEHYAPTFAVKLIDHFREELGLGRVHLAGNSLGGFLSWFYAAHYPQNVDRLILIDPIAYQQRLPPPLQLVTLPFVSDLARYVSPRFIVEQNVRKVYGDSRLVTRDTVDRFYELLSRRLNRTAMIKTLRQIMLYNKDPSIASHIRRIQCPTLLMWGDRDCWVPVSQVKLWKRDLPHAEVKIYPGIGHIPMEEIPDRTALDAHAFLSVAQQQNPAA